MPDGSLWKGTPIELETRYLIEQKLAPALELAGASLATMVKAQVYLTDASDTLGFLRVWSELVGDDGPALTIIPSPAKSIALEDARIEVNALALTTTAASKIRKIDAGLPRWYSCAPNAVQAGDLLLLSGVPPIDQDGQLVHPMLPPAFANFEDLARSQAAAIAQRAATLAAAAGTSLADTVRLMFFTNRLRECTQIIEGWQDIAPRQPWPVSFIGATPPHLPLGCELQADIWIYCPQQGEAT